MHIIVSFVLFCFSGIFAVEKIDSPTISIEESTLNQRLDAGVANQVYVISDPSNEKCILKIFTRKSLEDLQRSEELLQLIRNAGIRVPNSIVPPSKVGHQTITVLEFIMTS
ncbi:MAG TPA: hypothetical protein VLE96_02560 [Chlamydiales bacterium]|nr:hypothetical protein [Chlamydiales bacterium]